MPRIWTPQQKPPLGSQLDWSHPLAKYLIAGILANEQTGTSVRDFVDAGRIEAVTTWKTARDIYAQSSGVRSNIKGLAANSSLNFPAFTFVSSVLMGPTASANSIFCNINFQSRADINHIRIQHLNGSDYISITYRTSTTVTGTIPIVNGEYFTLACTYDPVSAIHTTYKNGKLDIAASMTTKPTINDVLNACMVAYNAGGSGSPFTLYSYLYNRTLSASEVAWLYQEPYAMIQPIGPRRFYSIPAGGVIYRPYIQHAQRIAA